jgi:hypothetical protein
MKLFYLLLFKIYSEYSFHIFYTFFIVIKKIFFYKKIYYDFIKFKFYK